MYGDIAGWGWGPGDEEPLESGGPNGLGMERQPRPPPAPGDRVESWAFPVSGTYDSKWVDVQLVAHFVS